MFTLFVLPGSGETNLITTEPATGAWYAAHAGAIATEVSTAAAVIALSNDLRTILFIISFHCCSHKQVLFL
jgi:hypothetical protein